MNFNYLEKMGLFLVLFIIFNSVSYSQTSEFEVVGFWQKPEPASTIAADGNFAFLGIDKYLEVIDVSNSVNPIFISRYLANGRIDKIEIISKGESRYLILEKFRNGIEILNVTNPNEIESIFSLPSSENGQDFTLSDDQTILYWVTNEQLSIINLSEISSPIVNIYTEIKGPKIAANNDYLFIDDTYSSGVKIYKISDVYNGSSEYKSIQLYCSGLGSCGVTTTFFFEYDEILYVSCHISGETLGVNYSYNEVQEFDINNIDSITYFRTQSFNWKAGKLIGDTLFTVSSKNEIGIYDLNKNSTLITSQMGENIYDLSVANNSIYFATGFSGMQIYSIEDNAQLKFAGQFDVPDDFYPADDLLVKNDYCYMIYLPANNTNGKLKVLDITSKSMPEVVGDAQINDQGNADLFLKQDFLLVLTETNLHILNIKDKTNPVVVNSLHFDDHLQDGKILGDKFYFIGSSSHLLREYDISDPANPVLIHSTPIIQSATEFDCNDSLAIIANVNTIQVLKLGEEIVPLFESSGEFYRLDDIKLSYPNLFISNGGFQTLKIDLVNKSVETLSSLYSFNYTYGSDLIIKDTLCYRNSYYEGISIVNISDVNNPEETSFFGISPTQSFDMDENNYVYVALPYRGMYILRNSIYTGLDEYEVSSVPLNFSIAQNYPNPFNPTTTIKYSIPKAGFVTIKVYDILGREIAVLVNEYKQTGTYEIKFDGSKLSSGVYLYRITSGSFSETRKMVLSK